MKGYYGVEAGIVFDYLIMVMCYSFHSQATCEYGS